MVRELILVVIVVLAGYVVFQLVRAMRINIEAEPEENRDATTAGRRSESEGAGAAQPDEDDADDVVVFDPTARHVAAAAAATGEPFQAALEMRQLHQEIARLDGIAQAQHDRIGALEATIEALREQLDTTVAVQGISPEYNEALVFARRGLDVDAIAERCGISVAEAELVRSLAQQGGGGDSSPPRTQMGGEP